LLLSTLALEGSEAASGGRPSFLLRYADLVLLALALPVFMLADLPLLGYAIAAAAWIAQHAVLRAAERGAGGAIARGDRRRALGLIGAATVGRLWVVTLPILLVGLLAEREAGLAAAVLAAVLVTVHLAAVGLTRLLYPEAARS
jgi:hypothetical protein